MYISNKRVAIYLSNAAVSDGRHYRYLVTPVQMSAYSRRGPADCRFSDRYVRVPSLPACPPRASGCARVVGGPPALQSDREGSDRLDWLVDRRSMSAKHKCNLAAASSNRQPTTE